MDQNHWGRPRMAPEDQPAEEEPFFLGNPYNQNTFSLMPPTLPWQLDESFSRMSIESRTTSTGLGFGLASPIYPYPVTFYNNPQLFRLGNFHERYPAQDAAGWYNFHDPDLPGPERQAPAHSELPRTPRLNVLQQSVDTQQCKYPVSLCEEGYACFHCNDPFCRRAADPRASNNLINDITVMRPGDIDRLFELFKDKIEKMMTHTPTNLVVMSLIDRLSQNKIDKFLVKLCRSSQNLCQNCNDTYGSKVMQKLIGRIRLPHQKTMLTNALFPHTTQLATKSDGCSVIMCILSSFSNEDNKLILHEISSNCYRIGTGKYGYTLLMHIINCCNSGPYRTYVSASVARIALTLAFHEYGNFVVQAVLEQRIECLNHTVICNLAGYFVQLSTDKYASNVVQNCIRKAPSAGHVNIIVKELLELSSDLFVHEFGNYVMQTALEISKEVSLGTHRLLLQKLNANAGRLKSKNFGRKLLMKFLPRIPR